MKHAITLITASALVGTANAGLTITNGDFEAPALASDNTFSTAIDDWFVSSTGGFSEYTFRNLDQLGDEDANLQIEGAGGYIYQSLGTLDGDELTVAVDGTAINRSIRPFSDVIIELFSGSFPTAANGTPLTGLTSLGSTTLTGADFSFTTGQSESAPIVPEQAAFSTGTFDVSGLSAGTEIWVLITSPGAGGGNAAGLDDLSLDVVVPEPTSLGLLGLGGLLIARRRRA